MKAILSLATLALASSLATAAPSKMPAGTYEVDTAHSTVGFEIPHMVISSVDGNFETFDGKITLADKFEKSSVVANVEAKSINTANAKRDDHLRSADFFDVKKHPKIKFESTEIKGSPESFKLTGNLTLHGVTKKVTFDGKLNGVVDDGKNDRAGFTASTVINRQDYGLTWSKAIEAGPVVGDELKLVLKIAATKPKGK